MIFICCWFLKCFYWGLSSILISLILDVMTVGCFECDRNPGEAGYRGSQYMNFCCTLPPSPQVSTLPVRRDEYPPLLSGERDCAGMQGKDAKVSLEVAGCWKRKCSLSSRAAVLWHLAAWWMHSCSIVKWAMNGSWVDQIALCIFNTIKSIQWLKAVRENSDVTYKKEPNHTNKFNGVVLGISLWRDRMKVRVCCFR